MFKAKTNVMLIVLALIFLVSIGGLRGEPQPTRTVWEYKVIDVDRGQTWNFEKILNQQAADGWELIQEDGTSGRALFFFKRPR